MKKTFDSVQAIVYELENGKVTRLARSISSHTNLPVLMLHRCPVSDNDCKHHLVFRVYLVSHLDSHNLLIKQFTCLEDFCLWFVTNKHYSSFEIVNYTCLTP